MSKKTDKDKAEVRETFDDLPVSEALRKNFMPYAMSVIKSRALPEIDGLKPSHRKLLYTMYEMGLTSGANRTKSANIAARTMLLNPHGDQGNYETMVRLTQNNETLLTPLVDGKGNFGKHYSRDMAYAASRYTEARLTPVASEFFKSIHKDTIEFVDNYDGTKKEPVLLPVTFPNILANPTEGIAVGMASSIPSFNLRELCCATILRITDPEKPSIAVMPAPDFTTGAQILYDRDAMKKAYETGRGSFKMRSVYHIDAKNRVIEVTQIPFTTTAEAIIDGVISAVKAGKVSEINDIRNETDLQGLRIAIDYKRSSDPESLMQKLFKLTKLEDSYSFNMTLLLNGTPKVLGVEEILDEWLDWRRACVVSELKYDLAKKEKELHLLEGLAKVLLDIDKAIRIIRQTEEDAQVIPNLMKGFEIDEEQATFIAEIKLRNLNRKYILDKTAAIEKLGKEIRTLNRQIKSRKEIDKIIVRTLEEVSKKYGSDRRTRLVDIEEAPVYDEADEIKDYDVTIYRTREGYVKKVAAASMRANPEIKVKEDDEIVQELPTTNTQEILFFTDKCNVYKTFAYMLTDAKPSELGEYMNNVLGLEEGESVIYAALMDPEAEVFIGFKNGKCARFPMSVYETKQNRKKLVKAFSDKSPVIAIFILKEPARFGMLSNRNKLLIFGSDAVPLKTTKTTQGVQVQRLSSRAEAVCLDHVENYHLETEKGFGYRSGLPAAGGVYDGQIKMGLA